MILTTSTIDMTSSPEMSPAASPRLPPPVPPHHDDIAAAPVLSPDPATPPHHITASPPVPPPLDSPSPPETPAPPQPPSAPVPEVAPAAPGSETPTGNSPADVPPPPPAPPQNYAPAEDILFLRPPPPKFYSPPVPEEDATASPPSMLIHGSFPPSPPKSVSPPPTSSIQQHAPPESSKTTWKREIVGICVGFGAFLWIMVIGVLIMVICKRRKNGGKVEHHCESPPPKAKIENLYAAKHKHNLKQNNSINAGDGDDGSPAPGISPFSPCFPCMFNFTYQQLEVATDNFSKYNRLGEGGFGPVHKGVLPNGRKVAVKQLCAGSQQGDREFQAEVETISRVHHKHLVSLVGYCISGVQRLLVYEFVPNRTVSFHLHGKSGGVLNWGMRLKTAIGSARGLAYLHEYCNPTIIHRDIKTSNILLDSKFEAKVSDFGLAKFFSDPDHGITHVNTRVVGTFGYLDPEYASSGKASDRSDVFSFGVVLLELITGRKAILTDTSSEDESLVAWAKPLLNRALGERKFDGLVDWRLQNNYNIQEMTKMISCAAACVRKTTSKRPRMSQIVSALEGNISLRDLDEEVGAGDSTVSEHCIEVDLKNMDKGISGLETRSLTIEM